MAVLRNPHPGEILKKEFLDEIGMSQNRLAQAIGVPSNRIHAIVNGTRDVTGDTDLRLCKFFGLSEGYFLRLQNDYDVLEAKRRIAGQLAKIKPYKSIKAASRVVADLKRRQLLMGLGAGALASIVSGRSAWPQSARRKRRIGVLTWWPDDDPAGRTQTAALAEGLAALGWIEGNNIQIDYRRGSGEPGRMGWLAKDLVAQRPDVLVGVATPAVTALLAETETIPIVFTEVSDPVGAGFVDSVAHPGRNATGFVDIEASLAGKWVEMLREVVPSMTRVGFLFNPRTAPENGSYYMSAFQEAARALAVEPVTAAVRQSRRDRSQSRDARRPGLQWPHPDAGQLRPDATPSHHRADRTAGPARDLSVSLLCNGRRPDVVRREPRRPKPAGRRLYRPYPQRREASQLAGATADAVRTRRSISTPRRRSASPCRRTSWPTPTS